jgi:hypothetical protein
MFDPKDWYWFVAGDSANVYSSARNIYVPTSDSNYATWLQHNGGAPSVPTESDIWYYVKDFQPWWLWDAGAQKVSQPSVGAWHKQQLRQYNTDVRTRIVGGGMTAAGIPIKTDDIARGFINDARTHADADPTYTTQWYGSDGEFYPVDAATIISMSDLVARHTSDCYLVFKDMDEKILLNTITTTAQVDAAYVGL